MCKNTTFFENRKNYCGIFSYYCLKIVNNAVLKSGTAQKAICKGLFFSSKLQIESNDISLCYPLSTHI